MLKFLSKNYSVLAGAVIVAGTNLLPLTAFAQTSTPVVEITPPIAEAPRLSVIQGKVTKIQGNIVTVKTPDYGPYCPPGQACLAIIYAGPTFKVDISRAIFQSPSGRRQSPRPKLKVNDSVVVAGQLGVAPVVTIPSTSIPPQPFIAQIVSKKVP